MGEARAIRLAAALAAWLVAACATPPPPVARAPAPWIGGREGWLRDEAYRRVIGGHRREIVRCLERGLADEPYLRGRVYLRLVVAPDGAVARARVTRSTLRHAGVEDCIVAEAYGWRFPRPEGDGWARATYPLMLGSN